MATKANVQHSMPDLMKTLIQPIVFIPIFIVLSGDWLWFEGWFYILLYSVPTCMTTVYLYFYDKGLFNERKLINSDSADGWVHRALLVVALGHLLIVPLDKRFAFSEPIIASIPCYAWMKSVAFLMLFPGVVLFNGYLICIFTFNL